MSQTAIKLRKRVYALLILCNASEHFHRKQYEWYEHTPGDLGGVIVLLLLWELHRMLLTSVAHYWIRTHTIRMLFMVVDVVKEK